MTDVIRVAYRSLYQKIAKRLEEAGLSSQRALIEAQIMVDADLLEVPSHGVRMLPNLLSAIASGNIIAKPKSITLRDFGAINISDFGNGTGRYASVTAMDKAITQAEKFGIGLCLAKNTSHWGRGHAYASRAAQRGYIGICTTNAMPTMASWGTTTPILGNNPLAIGVPGLNFEEPIVLDMAMSQMAMGKVATIAREKKSIPNNIGFNAEGKLSEDPQEIIHGALTPMGGHKGTGLSLMIELLTAALAGAAFSYQLAEQGSSGVDTSSTKIFIALKSDIFISPDGYKDSTARLFSYFTGCAPQFTFPSERGWLAKRRNLVAGVPLHREIAEQLSQVGIKL